MTKKILIGNYKGGVGKTLSTVCFGSLLAKDNKVLLIDLDPQSSLSEIVIKNTNSNMKLSSLDYSINYKKFINYAYELYIQMRKYNETSNLLKMDIINVYKDNINNYCLDVIPNSLYYKHSNDSDIVGLDDIAMLMGNDVKYLSFLPKLFNDNDFDKKYDYVFIDTPPSSNIITQSAFLYADYLLVPTICDEISQRGIEHYLKKIDLIYERFCDVNNEYGLFFKSIFGEKIKRLGTFETMRKGPSKDIQDTIWSQLDENEMHKFDTKIKDIDSAVMMVYNNIADIINKQTNVGAGEGPIEYKRGYKELLDEILARFKLI